MTGHPREILSVCNYVFVVDAEDGAPQASCQALLCHMGVINQKYYEVCVMVQYEAVLESRGGDGLDWARVLPCC